VLAKEAEDEEQALAVGQPQPERGSTRLVSQRPRSPPEKKLMNAGIDRGRSSIESLFRP
jgi:hypothetical protein